MHPKNSTATSLTQQATLTKVIFGGINEDLLQVIDNGNLDHGLDLACDLSLGITQLLGRLEFATNYGETAYCAEIRALGFLSRTVSGLLRSAQRGLDSDKEAGQ